MENKKYYVFFDVDGTIIRIKTMFRFLKYFHQSKSRTFGSLNYIRYNLITHLKEYFGASREYLNKRYYRQYKGWSEETIHSMGRQWFIYEKKGSPNLFFKNVINEIKRHTANGGEIVFVSGSFNPCLAPLANQLGVKHILATQLEIINGIYTGKILTPQTIGYGKLAAIQNFLEEKNFFNLKDCFAYGDHISDIPMLSLVGHPHAIAGNKKLENHAKANGWSILQPE